MTTSAQAEQMFRDRVAARGGVVVEPAWLGNAKRHRIVCSEGHEWAVRPSAVSQGTGICRICAGNDPQTAERQFRALVEQQGGRVVEPAWLGALKAHRVICGVGHESTPRPASVQQGGGICRNCSGCSPEVAERQFRESLARLGGVLLEPKWLGKGNPHRVRCPEGHLCRPTPSSVRAGRGICRACAGKDPAVAEKNFRDRVAELGGTVVEPVWLGNGKPHRLICSVGHQCAPWPASVQQGFGICRTCAGIAWDTFYVVTDPVRSLLKFGITSGGGRARLGTHRRQGFTVVNLLAGDLSGTTAPDAETAVLATLRLAGEPPVRGREYFDAAVLALVLDVAGPLTGYARPGGA